MSRRSFLKFCSAMAGVLALPAAFGPRIATALETAPSMPVIWLHGQACGGDTAAFLRSSSPTASELLLRLLSVDYQPMLMTVSGGSAVNAMSAARSSGSKYLAVIEGSVPRGADGMYCTVGGRPFADVVREVCGGAVATIAVGSCAVDGGAPRARKGVTEAVGVDDVHPGSPLVNLPGCPVNVENLTATVVHYLTFGELPPMGAGHRPLFAYGGLVHNQCERRAHFEFGEFATEWGDAGAQQGWCLYKLGCKGPETFANCPTKRYAEGTSWAVEAGHGCIGCTMSGFWDTMLPAYRRLPSPLPFASTISVDQVGGVLVGGVAALAGAHAVGSYARAHLLHRHAAESGREAEPQAAEEGQPGGAVEPTPRMPPEPVAAEPPEATASNEEDVAATAVPAVESEGAGQPSEEPDDEALAEPATEPEPPVEVSEAVEAPDAAPRGEPSDLEADAGSTGDEERADR